MKSPVKNSENHEKPYILKGPTSHDKNPTHDKNEPYIHPDDKTGIFPYIWGLFS